MSVDISKKNLIEIVTYDMSLDNLQKIQLGEAVRLQ